MRFPLAVLAITMVSSPACAMDTFASSRAIPPLEVADLSPAPQQSLAQPRLTDLVLREAASTPSVLHEPSDQKAVRRKDLSSSVDSERQQTCIAQAVYYESKGEPVRGQRAVADVILNRTRRSGFATTPCGVIHQPHQFTNAHRWRVPAASDPLWQRAQDIARSAILGIGSVSQVITHFHAASSNPGWSMRRVAAIGRHIFY